MPREVRRAIDDVNERAALEQQLEYPTTDQGTFIDVVVRLNDELQLSRYRTSDCTRADVETCPIPASEFLSEMVRTIVGSDKEKYASRREAMGGIPPGTHLVVGHNITPGDYGDFGPIYSRVQPKVTVDVEGDPYHAVLLGPIKTMSNDAGVENWEIPYFARQAVGQLLGAAYTDGGYRLDTEGGGPTITDISPMATGHVFDRLGDRDTQISRRDRPWVPATTETTDSGTVKLDPLGRVIQTTGETWTVANFRGGPQCRNPVVDAEYQDTDTHRISLADNHTTRYRDRTISVVQAAQNGSDPPEWTPEIAGDWPQPLGNPRNTGHFEGVGPEFTPNPIWVFDGDSESERPVVEHRDIVLGEDHLYVLTENGPVFALDPLEGEVVWSFDSHSQAGTLQPSSLAVDDDALYLTMGATENGRSGGYPAIHALSTDDGDPIWQYEFPQGEAAVGPPTVADGRLYAFAVSSGDRYGFALDTDAGGDEVWLEQTDAETPQFWAQMSPPAVANGSVYVHSGGRLRAFDADTGERTWTSDRIDYRTFAPVTVADDGTLLTVGESSGVDYDVFAFDPASGGVRWRSLGPDGPEFTRDAPIATADRVAYVPERGSQAVYPLRLSDGEMARDEPLLAEESLDLDHTTMAVSNSTLYYGDTTGTVYAVDTDTGDERFQLDLRTGTISYAPVVTENAMFLAADRVRALRVCRGDGSSG